MGRRREKRVARAQRGTPGMAEGGTSLHSHSALTETSFVCSLVRSFVRLCSVVSLLLSPLLSPLLLSFLLFSSPFFSSPFFSSSLPSPLRSVSCRRHPQVTRGVEAEVEGEADEGVKS